MLSKSKSKTSSLKNSFNLKSHNNHSSNSSIQLILPPYQQGSKQFLSNQKASARSKYKKQNILKKIQKEIKEIKVQIMQLKSQSNTANLTQVSSRQQLSNESVQQGKQRGRKKSLFKHVEQCKINAFELNEYNKENRNTHNLSNCNIVPSELKQPTHNQGSATLYHENRVKYRNLEQSNYYIDYYLLN